MERDRLIAIALVVGLIFLFVALIGIVAVTGFVLLFVTNDNAPQAIDNTPIIRTVDSPQQATGTNAPTNPSTIPPATGTTPPGTQPEAVCGDGLVDTGEQCEANSNCAANQVCNLPSCKCEDVTPPEPEKTLVAGLQVDSLVFVPQCVTFDGSEGLGVSQIILKNTSDKNFTYSGSINISAAAGTLEDKVTTKKVSLTVKAGKTERLYLNQATRTEKFLFLGNSAQTAEITINFGAGKYIEYSRQLKGQDFSTANCQ